MKAILGTKKPQTQGQKCHFGGQNGNFWGTKATELWTKMPLGGQKKATDSGT